MAEPASKSLKDYKAPYPDPEANEKRFAIFLEPKENEEQFKVQVVIGRKEMVDPVNRHFLIGSVEEKDVQGWGYPYLKAQLSPGCAGTRMAVLDGQPNVEKFVTLHYDKLHRYNSKLPIVVYVPKDAEVRYVIWSSDPHDRLAEIA